MTVRFTPSARDQFLRVIAYICRDSPAAADAFRRKAQKRLSRLHKFPRSGRTLPEFPDLPFREIVVPPYRFFYRTEGKTAWIVAVWHGAQLPEEPHDRRANEA
ncbi:type II toxin-antitoxin system RelE/ParE family toxin [Anaerobaca lacustris]|uniref:Type II toxin-antitoxin system RelE/ParE family toxin n=1 Tax=Anaerobaca lacustris TaxID=3044600 RepID=A0AAW6U1I3_9BACT|nr:type II toxin-antitoxin system RelE/ParE family toxin [Sedimentisphaerales bacterium M17dextr]